jgi:hypothetical protein
MTTIVVGGHSRNVGKTSIVSAIIAAWPRYAWTAVKMSSHWHEDNGITAGKEEDRNSRTDTGRFLAAGATRSFWIRFREGRMEEALPRLAPVLNSNPYVIIESNGIVRYIRPSLYLMVHRCDVVDYKKSARETIGCVDAIVALNPMRAAPGWEGITPDLLAGIPVFPVPDPSVLPQDLIEFIRLRLV